MILSRGTVNGFISVNLAFGVGVTMAILISGNISGNLLNVFFSLNRLIKSKNIYFLLHYEK